MTGRAILRFSPILVVLVAAACGGGGGGGSKPAVITRLPQARIYLVRDGKLAPVERGVEKLDDPNVLRALKQGPTSDERQLGFTAAPAGDRVLVLAQQVFTLTALHRTDAVTIDGKRYTRTDFEDEVPAILVESPLPSAGTKSPLRVRGTANTFEATFDYDLLDASGKVLAHHFVTATSGSGVRGTFDFAVRFSVPRAEAGMLLVYEISAANGKRIHELQIPVILLP